MKWIGQHIYDLASRFRNDVFLEDISTGTIASGAHLGLDSNNKIVKAVDGGGDLTSIVAGTGLSGDNLSGPIPELTVDASQPGITSLGTLTNLNVDNININGDTITASADLAIIATGNDITVDSDTLTITSSTADQPIVKLVNITNDDQASQIVFEKLRADDAVAQSQNLGEIWFRGQDSAQNTENYAFIVGEIDVSTSGQESGQLRLGVASHDGSDRGGLTITGGSQATEVDVAIGRGAASVTTVAGTLTMGSTAALTNAGLVAVANQSSITGLGTISSGVWNGTAIASAYLDADTAHLSGAQTFTGTKTLNSFKGTAGATVTNILDEDAMGSDSATALATQQSIKAYADTKSALATQKQLTFHSFTDDIDTAKHYVGLVDADSESTATTGVDMPLTFPVASKLLQVTLRSNKNLSGLTYTWRLETQATGVGYGTGPTIVGTQSGAGPAQVGHAVYDFTESLDSGDNVVDAFDAVYLSLQSSGGTSNTKYFITCVWEVDVSSY